MIISKTITALLREKKLLSDERAKEVDMQHLQTGKTEEEIIREKKLISEEDLLKTKAELYGVPFVDLMKVGFAPVSISLIPKSVAEKYKLIPFGINQKNGEIMVAMVNPIDVETIEFLERKTEMKIVPYMAVPEQIIKLIEERYEQELTTQVKEALKETDLRKRLPDLDNLGEIIREAPIAKIVATILEFAMRSRASDVHIEPQEGDTRVRYRIDGILHEKLILPKRVHEAVISRIKILSEMKIDERRVPQDGRFTFIADEQEVDLRISTAPTVYGEKIVMRLLKKQATIPTLPELGLRGKALRDLQIASERPHGIIIVCGPTGSGKTTTLYSVLSKLSTIKVNVMTIEDPVEYQIEGVNQVQVNPQAGLTFASAMRSFLRQDPNIIMVGEIRDQETTELAIHAALTGHLVFSTLHTNNAAGAPPRLIDMKAEPFLLVSSLNCVLAQRVLRRVCSACKEELAPSAEVIEDLKNVLGDLYPATLEEQTKRTGKNELVLWRGRGCEECNKTGYIGRIAIFEVMPISDKIIKLVLEKSASGDIEKQARTEGMITMKQDGYLKAIEGITTIEEVLRVAEY